MVFGSGTFSGAGGHRLEGTFVLTETENGILMTTGADFYFDGAKNPQWSLMTGLPTDMHDAHVKAMALKTQFGRLEGEFRPVTGPQSYIIPSNIKLNDYDTLFLWCSAMPYILGTGPIERRLH